MAGIGYGLFLFAVALYCLWREYKIWRDGDGP